MLLILAALFSFRLADAGLPQSGMWRHGFAVADMNGDGHPDLAFTSPRRTAGPPVIFLNDGKGRFARWEQATFPPLSFDYGAVAAADFDDNGAIDLAVGVHYRGVVVLLHDGQGRFTAVTDGITYPSSFSSRAVTVTDWNGDGRLDVAAVSDGPRPPSSPQLGVTVFENLGSAWRTMRSATKDIIHGDSIAAGDVDGDGLADLVTASLINDPRILRLGGDGGLARRKIDTLLAPGVVRAVDVADFDGDGRDEIVVGYSAEGTGLGALEVVSFPSGGRPPQALWSEPNAAVSAVATGDLNGDGAVDLVAVLEDGRTLTFRGDGLGTLIRDADINPPAGTRGCSAYAVRLADLDADRRAEIIATFAGEACPSFGRIEVWRNAPAQADRRRSVRH